MNQGSSNVRDFLLDGKEPARSAFGRFSRITVMVICRRPPTMLRSNIVQAGGQKGDRVILVGENTFFWVANYLGVLKAGRARALCHPPFHQMILMAFWRSQRRGLRSCSGALQ